MSSEICLHNATVLTGYSVMKNCAVLIKNYKIIDVFNEARFASKKFKDDVKFIDLQGACIAPGFIDTHIHGIEGHGTATSLPILFSKCRNPLPNTALPHLFRLSIPPRATK